MGENKYFPWKNKGIAKLKAEILKMPFSEIDEFIEELSEKIISLKENNFQEINEESPDEDILDESYEGEDGWEPILEYGIGESSDSEDEEINEDNYIVEEREIDRDYTDGNDNMKFYYHAPEIEIIRSANNEFIPKVNTFEVLSKWRYEKTKNKHIDNAGTTVIQSINFRAQVLQDIGNYFIKELYNYLCNLKDPDRHWYLKPLSMTNIYGKKRKDTISRVVNKTLILLPNNELDYLNNYFDKTQMPISGKALSIEISKLIKSNPKIFDREIADKIQEKARLRNIFDLTLSIEMIRYWRKRFRLKQ